MMFSVRLQANALINPRQILFLHRAIDCQKGKCTGNNGGYRAASKRAGDAESRINHATTSMAASRINTPSKKRKMGDIQHLGKVVALITVNVVPGVHVQRQSTK